MLFHYVACGLPDVWLANGFTKGASPTGGESFTIMHLKELHLAIGRALVEKPSLLTGDEFRFLRTELGMSRKSLAEMLGLTFEALKKWEQSGDEPLTNKLADSAIRSFYIEAHEGDGTFSDLVKRINNKDNLKARALRFKETAQGWLQDCA